MSTRSRRRCRNERQNQPPQSQPPLNKAKNNQTPQVSNSCNRYVIQYRKSNVINSKIDKMKIRRRNCRRIIQEMNLKKQSKINLENNVANLNQNPANSVI
ncbi:MAG: hypothetical protein EZS28_055811 [Streblomastix strix]|uniref:Uncharacterized protein n=1 Tax=Streblomastix strix TaxID=222440 RepID=A0A5J4PTZ8_9EUKA|nr:MAG: hypothetical protein EZS28_055811 [Streblomastix strix]